MSKKTTDKPWGKYIVLENTGKYWIKKLYIKKDARLSLQSHNKRSEVWVVLSGEILATKGDSKVNLKKGDTIKIEEGEKHRIKGVENSWVLEAAFGSVKEDDIIRYEDDYGREDE